MDEQNNFGFEPSNDPNNGFPAPDQNGFGTPAQDNFGAPQDNFGAQPQDNFGAPQDNFGAPQNDFGAPQNDFSAPPQNDFNAQPQNDFNAQPQNDFSAQPQNNFGAPQNDLSQPAPTYDYNQQAQPNYSQPNYNAADADLEKTANTVKTLGIVSLVVSIVLGCCCTIAGPIVGIVGLVKANGLKASMDLLTPEGQKSLSTGKALCIAGIIVGAVWIVLNIILTAAGTLSEMLEESM